MGHISKEGWLIIKLSAVWASIAMHFLLIKEVLSIMFLVDKERNIQKLIRLLVFMRMEKKHSDN